ncbi:hypothetical protein [Streptomyces sp. NRRL S-31]|uniref:hypothetical protein n=1 Tax=Streptomyces sp. NRRL S-31 TaxID=1463898 RepID=UPI000AAE90D3|nr:hypothetical protein [Streptomyces sp. NRRL S-31]
MTTAATGRRQTADKGPTTAAFEDVADELGDTEGAAPLTEPANRFARAHLRTVPSW